MTRFEQAFEQYQRRSLTGDEAGELLGMSGRHFRRLCVRYEEDGVAGLRDRRIGTTASAGTAEKPRYPQGHAARPPDCISIYGIPMMCRWAEGVPAHIIYTPVSL